VIPGLTYLRDFVSEADEKALLADVDGRPWLSDLKRRVQHYGYKYDYKARGIDASMFVGPVPVTLLAPGKALADKGLVPNIPDQLIVNEYEPGQGILAHVDCVPCFEDGIATLSLGSAVTMDLVHKRTDRAVAVTLERRSVLVFCGEARFEWQHGIKQRKTDDGAARSRRVSLTYRKVKLARS
jgi:alkylated DNA repair dioxygenase AlkB